MRILVLGNRFPQKNRRMLALAPQHKLVERAKRRHFLLQGCQLCWRQLCVVGNLHDAEFRALLTHNQRNGSGVRNRCLFRGFMRYTARRMNPRRTPSPRQSPANLFVFHHWRAHRWRWLSAATVFVLALLGWLWWRQRPPKPFVAVVTLAGTAQHETPVRAQHEPFGLAADDDGNLYVSESTTGRVYRLVAGSYVTGKQPQFELIAENLATPSALALDDDGKLLIANTGAHTILRFDPERKTILSVAGKANESGLAEDDPQRASFNGPVGLAVSGSDVFIADTYNDRILLWESFQRLKLLAGGGQGFADGVGAQARFDTPCGVAVAPDGSLLVADTGNHRIRRVTKDGAVTTVAGTGEPDERDGAPLEAAFSEPMAIAIRDKHSFFVADAGGSSVRLVTLSETADKVSAVTTLAGGFPYGLVDGELANARLNRPVGLAWLPDGALAVADSGNGLVRALVPAKAALGFQADATRAIVQPAQLRALLDERWPFAPVQNRREIAGTFGEIRGERLPDHDAWFHNGLDIPGAYGEQVLAMLTETVTRPLAIESPGTGRERVRLPLFGYIHLRLGRDQNDNPLPGFPPGAFTFQRDNEGRVTAVRLRRGTVFQAGAPIGTLNRMNHVHLIAGASAYEFNALSALRLPGLTDTVPPVIESVSLFSDRGEAAFSTAQPAKAAKPARSAKRAKAAPPAPKPPANASLPIAVSGKLRVAVRAYDQADGNARHRRLGLYRLGYQLLAANGAIVRDGRDQFVFDRLPADWSATVLTYAEGSQSGYQGVTVFAYLVTNVVRGGQARASFCDTTTLPPGQYTLRVFAADFFGNQAQQDVPLTVAAK